MTKFNVGDRVIFSQLIDRLDVLAPSARRIYQEKIILRVIYKDSLGGDDEKYLCREPESQIEFWFEPQELSPVEGTVWEILNKLRARLK